MKIYQVDAFTGRMFAGNPAAVCPLQRWLPDRVMQAIAAENNLSETAFQVPQGDDYELRWFTPEVEVDLCGHATLASGFVVFHFLEPARSRVAFHTRKAGTLSVERDGSLLAMDFPSRPARRASPSAALNQALGAIPAELWVARDHMAVFPSADEVKALKPDFVALAGLGCWAMIATAPGENGVDFVSRFFGPAQGVNEDPVTGSAHCTLIPYWAERLGKKKMLAHQLSRRGGELDCELLGERVKIAGQAVLYMEGEIAPIPGQASADRQRNPSQDAEVT